MANVKVITDSLADIPAALAQALDVTQIPCIVRFGSQEFRDRVDLSPSEFYRRLAESRQPPATSQPPVAVFEATFRQVAETTDQILSIHVIGNLSGTLNAARLAAQNVTQARIECVDSQQISMGMGWLVILAARAAKAGLSLGEIKGLVEDAMPRVHVLAMLDTLEYARRGGRLGKGEALLGALLNVKPLLSAVRGEILPVENVRTQKRALERLVEIVMDSGTIQELAVIHAESPELARKLRMMLNGAFPVDRIVMSETGPVLGTHRTRRRWNRVAHWQ